VSNDSFLPSVDALKQAIVQHGPVASGVEAGTAWDGYTGGILNGPPCSGNPADINHEVVIVGWDDAYNYNGGSGPVGVWIIKNSWWTTWGEQGYGRVPYGTNNIGFAASNVIAIPAVGDNATAQNEVREQALAGVRLQMQFTNELINTLSK